MRYVYYNNGKNVHGRIKIIIASSSLLVAAVDVAYTECMDGHKQHECRRDCYTTYQLVHILTHARYTPNSSN